MAAATVEQYMNEIPEERKEGVNKLRAIILENLPKGFEEGMSYEEKYQQVCQWWNDFRFHLSMAIKTPTELNRFLGNSLSS